MHSMPRTSSRARWVHTTAGLLIVAAVALRLLAARLPGTVQGTEAVLIGVGFVYAGAAIALRYTPWGETAAAQLLLTGGGIALATAVLAVAGPWLPDLVPLAIGVTCCFILTVDPLQTRRFMAAVLALGITGLVVLWAEALAVLHRPPLELAVYGMVLTAIVMLVFVTPSAGHRSPTRRGPSHRSHRQRRSAGGLGH